MFPSSLKTRLSLVVLPSHRAILRPTQGSMSTFPKAGKKKMRISPMKTENSHRAKIAFPTFTGAIVGHDGRQTPLGSLHSESFRRVIRGVFPPARSSEHPSGGMPIELLSRRWRRLPPSYGSDRSLAKIARFPYGDRPCREHLEPCTRQRFRKFRWPPGIEKAKFLLCRRTSPEEADAEQADGNSDQP